MSDAVVSLGAAGSVVGAPAGLAFALLALVDVVLVDEAFVWGAVLVEPALVGDVLAELSALFGPLSVCLSALRGVEWSV
jgi:hypothetical protein